MSEAGPGRPEGADPGNGVLGSVRGAARSLIAFAETRARLAASDVEEQAVRLAEIGLWLAAALFFCSLALVIASVFVVRLAGEANRALAAGLVTLLWLAAGAVAAILARKRIAGRPRFFSATLAELAKDRERMDKS